MVTGRVSQKTYSTLGHKIFSCFTVDGKLAQEEISHLQQFMDGLDLKRRIPENEKGFLNVIFKINLFAVNFFVQILMCSSPDFLFNMYFLLFF